MAVRNTRECLESYLGDAMKARTQSLYLHSKSLGPPDLCWLEKVKENSLVASAIGTSAENIGFTHHVVGLPVLSAAHVTAYIGEMIQTQQPGKWFQTSTYKVVSGVYCVYDAFSGVDVRVEVRVPGQTSAFAVGSDGKRVEITEDLWNRVLVSGCLRSLNTAGVPDLMCLKALCPFETKAVEDGFLAAAKDLFKHGLNLGSDGASIRTTDPAHSRMARLLFDYFMGLYRFKDCAAFFTSLVGDHPAVTIYIAAAQVELARPDASLEMLANLALSDSASRPYVMLKEADILLSFGKGGAAAELARTVVREVPQYTEGWLTLARAYLSIDEYEGCLVALNAAPMKEIHRTRTPGTLPEVTMTETLMWSECVLPGLVDFQAGIGYDLHVPSQNHASDVKRAYGILVDLYRKVKWAGLLELRSHIFVMEVDSAVGANIGLQSPKRGGPSAAEEVSGALSGTLPPLLLEVDLNAEDGLAKRTRSKESEVKFEGGQCASFSKDSHNKRLCTSWLDGLFHALYQDLNAVSHWVNEEKRGETPLKPPGTWLALADIAKSLGLYAEAETAYQKCLAGRWSVRAWDGLIDMYARTDLTVRALGASEVVAKHYLDEAAQWNARGPKDIPTITRALARLVSTQGFKAVSSAKDTLETTHLDKLGLLRACDQKWCSDGFDR